jgi:hypothetical protein
VPGAIFMFSRKNNLPPRNHCVFTISFLSTQGMWSVFVACKECRQHERTMYVKTVLLLKSITRRFELSLQEDELEEDKL